MQTPNFLFSCCTSFETLNHQNSQISSLIRNAMTKGKKTNLASLAHSPKSSLKTFKSLKNLNNLSNLHVCNSTVSQNQKQIQTKLTSAREIPVTYYLKKIDKFLSPCSNQPKKQVYSDLKQSNIPASIPSIKSNIKFSYNNLNNPEKKTQTPPSPLPSKNKKSQIYKSEISNRKSNFTTLASECSQKNNQKTETKKNKSGLECEQNDEERMIKLGQSRNTIKSRVEIGQNLDKSIKIDESCIIIDVFNASDSQLKKWDSDNKK